MSVISYMPSTRRITFHVIGAVASAALLLPATGQAQLIYEPFLSGPTPANGEYADGADLTGTNPTVTGFPNAWGGTNTASLFSTSTGLTYLNGSVSLGAGGAAIRRSDGSGSGSQNVRRDVSATMHAENVPGEGWFAFLLKPNSTENNTTSDPERITVSLDYDSGNAPVDVRVGFTNDQLKLMGQDVGTATAGETYLMILKLASSSVGPNTDETVDLWVNPSDSSDETALTNSSLYTASALDNFTFREWGLTDFTIEAQGLRGSGNSVDELLFADSLDELNALIAAPSVGVPEPRSIAIWTLLGLIAAGFAWRRRVLG